MANEFHWGPTNPHPLSKMRTELVWDGKYSEFGNRREVDIAACGMPMQKIETVDEPRQRAAAEGQADMFEQKILRMREAAPPYKADFRNILVWGDNKLVTASLLKEFKGQINLIYIDPPFRRWRGLYRQRRHRRRERNHRQGPVHPRNGRLQGHVGQGHRLVLHMLSKRLTLMKELLSQKGTIYVHVGWVDLHYVKAIMDNVFGRDHFTNQVIWKRQTAHSDTTQGAEHMGRLA